MKLRERSMWIGLWLRGFSFLGVLGKALYSPISLVASVEGNVRRIPRGNGG